MKTLDERLDNLCDVKFITLDDPDEIATQCCIGMNYDKDHGWVVWLAESDIGDQAAAAYRMEDGELQDKVLEVGMGYSAWWGEERDIFSDWGSTLEEAVSKLEKKVAILRKNPDYILLFTHDD